MEARRLQKEAEQLRKASGTNIILCLLFAFKYGSDFKNLQFNISILSPKGIASRI